MSEPESSGQRVTVPSGAGRLAILRQVMGPAYLVAVGYMDPGNWATDLAAGSRYGYSLLWVVLFASLLALLMQSLCCRLGIATGLDLAQACRLRLDPRVRLPLWLLAQVAIAACDLAELVGSAIALQLLFRLPLVWGVVLTAGDTLLLLLLQRRGVRRLEALVIALVVLVGTCFAIELFWVQPDWGEVLAGFVPAAGSLRDPHRLYLAAAILGATVMPHNLYLHSSLMQTRHWSDRRDARHRALRWATLDSLLALGFAFLVNASILVMAAGSFHGRIDEPVGDLSQAYRLLSPLLGSSAASVVFAVALLASGQSSTLTGTLAGQVVMEGFLDLRLPEWQRRLLTRCLALIPALATVILLGEKATTELLVLSQVVLSLQLPFAVIPLVVLCGSAALMGDLRAPPWLRLLAWIGAALIVLINGALLLSQGMAP